MYCILFSSEIKVNQTSKITFFHRDAKLIRRVDSPIAATVPPAQVEGKRTPKPKPPKGASPEPITPATTAAAKPSPPAKIKVNMKLL